MIYRREIDGLRAVAVVPVIFFHAGFDFFEGGFVGVDVFFVISGYLITSIILSELESDTFTITSFYDRRARRILPALTVVMLACIPFAWFWMFPYQLKDFAESIFAVSIFVSNILFYREGGYFGPAAELKPLLHTWSLAVEEQFYIVFPILMITLWRFGKRVLAAMIAGIGVISFAAAQFGGNFQFGAVDVLQEWQWHSQPSWASFYLATGRAWELMIGALVAIYLGKKSEIKGDNLAAASGCFLITYSIFAFDSSTPFPSAYTLVPVIGTALVILFGAPNTFVGRFLSIPVFVGVGLISYSAYLWHQPLFAFARLRSLNEPSVWIFIGLSVAALLLAYLSWRYVEQPFRNRRKFSTRRIFGIAATTTCVMILIGVSGRLGNGFEGRLSDTALEKLAYRYDRGTLRETCDAGVGHYTTADERCSAGADIEPTIAIVGDSHARELAHILGEQAETRGLAVKVLVYSGCPPILGIRRIDRATDTCPRNNEEVFDYLSTRSNITHVILFARWTVYIDTQRFDNGEGGKEHGDPVHIAPVSDELNSIGTEARRKKLGELLVDSVLKILEMGKTVILVYPVPEVGWNVPEYLARAEMHNIRSGRQISTSYARFVERNAQTVELLDSLGSRPRLFRVNPAAELCDSYEKNRCVAQLDGTPLYFDDNHLNSVGAAPIVRTILDRIENADNSE